MGYLATFNLVRSEKQHRLIRDHRRRKSMQSSVPQMFVGEKFLLLCSTLVEGGLPMSSLCHFVAWILNVTGDFYIKPSRFKKKHISNSENNQHQMKLNGWIMICIYPRAPGCNHAYCMFRIGNPNLNPYFSAFWAGE